MFRLNIIVSGLVLAVVFSFVHCLSVETVKTVKTVEIVKVEIVTDINKFLLRYPGVKIQQMRKELLPTSPNQYISMKYTLGHRINGKI